MSENEATAENATGVLRLKSNPDRVVEMETLCWLDDYEVKIAKEFSAAFALRYVDFGARYGLDASSAMLLEESVGAEAYQKILHFEELTSENLIQLMAILQKKVLGAMDAPKDKKLRSV